MFREAAENLQAQTRDCGYYERYQRDSSESVAFNKKKKEKIQEKTLIARGTCRRDIKVVATFNRFIVLS